jgi:hypothetical protein
MKKAWSAHCKPAESINKIKKIKRLETNYCNLIHKTAYQFSLSRAFHSLRSGIVKTYIKPHNPIKPHQIYILLSIAWLNPHQCVFFLFKVELASLIV